MADRAELRLQYLKEQGWDSANCQALQADASFRRYFRLQGEAGGCMLMDAPPPKERIEPFLLVAQHLEVLGLRPPRIYHADTAAGFALLEDLGDDTFTRMLNAGGSERSLYALAVESLLHLQQHGENTCIDVPPYDDDRLLNEVALFVDWYYPALTGKRCPAEVRASWLQLWQEVLTAMPRFEPTLVLRDFHVDNLMQVMGAQEQPVCAFLDFQDAVIGEPSYDLASLLEDARRDLNEEERTFWYECYLNKRPDLDKSQFSIQYQIIALQRHLKIAGIFLRLYLRDGKPVYLQHIPRVIRWIQYHLGAEKQAPLKEWLDKHFPLFSQPLPGLLQLEQVRDKLRQEDALG